MKGIATAGFTIAEYRETDFFKNYVKPFIATERKKKMKEILYSKKGFMALVAVAALTIVTIVSIVTGANFIDQTMFWATLSSIVGPYLISQGIADYGNGKAKPE